jgi:Zn-dependent protease with chaperone function
LSAWLGIAALGVLAAFAFTLGTSLAMAALWPWARRRLRRTHPALRARLTWLACVAPGVLPALLVALCFSASLPEALGISHDHCVRHHEHPHLCLIHRSAPLTPVRTGVLLAAAGIVAAAVAPELTRLARTRRWLASLGLAARQHTPDVDVVDSDLPFSFAAGLWHPRIRVADALVRELPRPQLAALIEHERAHARRRDPLQRLVATVLSRAHLPRVRAGLLEEWVLAAELACDAEAGDRVKDRLVVAEAILAVERAFGRVGDGSTPDALPAFRGGAVAERVRELLASERPAPSRWAGRLAVALVLALAPLLTNPLHHATEHLLSLVARVF